MNYFEQDKTAAISFHNKNTGIDEAMDGLYDEYNLDTFSIPKNSLPLLSETIRLSYQLPKILEKIEQQGYENVIIPSYSLLMNTDPSEFELNFGVYFHDLYRVFVEINWFNTIKRIRALRKSLKADEIYTNSNITKDTLEQAIFYSSDHEIQVVEPIVDSDFYEESNKPENFDLPKNYILYVGSYVERKNVSFLLDIIEELPEIHLVIAGNTLFPDKKEKFLEEVDRRNLGNRVHTLGYITKKDLRRTYSLAHAYVLPSKYGGYEMTPLEAEKCGTPAIVYEKIPSAERVDSGRIFSEFEIKTVVSAIKNYI